MSCSDKAGRSVPAPGRGALSIAREVSTKHPLPILDLEYRARQLAFRRTQISQWLQNEREMLRGEVEFRKSQNQDVDEDFFASRVADIEREAAQQEKDALAVYGMLVGSDERIAPMRRALAGWGLTADDIGVHHIHGTSTGANVSFNPIFLRALRLIPLQEKNETDIWNNIFTSLSRTSGNAVPIMAQKSLCGHSKGGSAAWQLAGLLQSVSSGIVPGNRNAEYVMVSYLRPFHLFLLSNIDALFKKHTYLMFPSKTIHTDGIKAGVMVRRYCCLEYPITHCYRLVVLRLRSSRRHLRDCSPTLLTRCSGAVHVRVV